GYVMGGIVSETGLGAEGGSGAVFVAEADESDGSFLMLSPQVAVVTSVEADHLDNYAGLAEIEDAFAAFARRIAPGGVLIACADDPAARSLAVAAAALPIRVRTYGEADGADYKGTSVVPRGLSVRLEGHGGGRARAGAGGGAGAAGAAGGGRPRPSQRAERGRRLRRRPRARPAGGAGRAGRQRAGCLPGRAAADGAQGAGGRGHRAGQFRPSSDRARSRPAGGARHRARRAGHRRLPAPPVQPHPDLRRPVRRRPRPGRRGVRARRLRRARGSGTRCDRGAGGQRGARRPGGLPARRRGRARRGGGYRPAGGPGPDDGRRRCDGPGPADRRGAAGPRGYAGMSGSRPRTRWKAAFFGVAAVAIVAGVAWALLGSRFLVVRSVEVTGAGPMVSRAEVLAAAHIKLGLPLIRVNTSAVAHRVGGIRQVQSAQVSRNWPDTVVISVRLRIPLFAVAVPGGYALVDAFGVDVRDSARRPAGLPLLSLTAGPGVTSA